MQRRIRNVSWRVIGRDESKEKKGEDFSIFTSDSILVTILFENETIGRIDRIEAIG